MNKKPILSFARKKGRKLSIIQNEKFNSGSDFIFGKDPKNTYNIEKTYALNSKIWLEIGFGNGKHLAQLAQNNKNIQFIGCEPFINGVANLAVNIHQENLSNIIVWQNDAKLILNICPDDRIERIYILFPDPWPKLKHHKRRIISHETLDLIYMKLEKFGKCIIATDHEEYANYMLKIFEHRDDFKFDIQNIRNEPKGWFKTNYQLKAENKGIMPYFFTLNKI